jgi:N6-adenosine-specific RNA methylase IME4
MMRAIILPAADPPMSFITWSVKGNGRGAVPYYPTMSLDEIRALNVDGAADDNSALFLLAFGPSLPDAIRAIEAWSFIYRTIGFSWFKSNKSGEGLKIGLGYYTRSNAELCLMGKKGKIPISPKGVSQVDCSLPREHTRKPDEVYELIERINPGARYLELFASHRWPGWHAWRNEVDSDIDLTSLDDGVYLGKS